ncbi:MAG: FAD-binding oxidoreductase [Proteobacteria bacterium]|nr:FAD-binding oxidoreductase [Pseudomonadota bacterium]
MPAPLQRVQSSPTLPPAADVVIIGGGVVGSFAAYYLAKRGVSVALVEKGLVGAEQSSRNWGWCRQQNRDERELPLATASLDLWQRFGEDNAEDTGFRRCGLFYLSNDDAELARWSAWRDFARGQGVTTHMLSGDEASARGSATGQRWKGGVFSPSDGTADPSRAVPAVARAIMKTGGTVHEMCAARGLEFEAGRICGVVTEAGTIRTRTVVMAGGAWASSFCRQYGIRFPQASVRSSILSVTAPAQALPDALHTAEVSITRRLDGSYTLAISGKARVDPTPQQLRFAREFVPMFAKRWASLAPGNLTGWRAGHETLATWRLDRPTPMEANRILDPVPDQKQIDETYLRAGRLFAAIRQTQVVAQWAGYIDSTPDGIPVIDAIADRPGFILAAGFSGHGFGIGPGAGHLIADLITGRTPLVDPKHYGFTRFTSGKASRVSDF